MEYLAKTSFSFLQDSGFFFFFFSFGFESKISRAIARAASFVCVYVNFCCSFDLLAYCANIMTLIFHKSHGIQKCKLIYNRGLMNGSNISEKDCIYPMKSMLNG